MAARIDYQVHSFYSHDGLAEIEAHCERAIELGLYELGMSEHKDFDPNDPAVHHFDYEKYMRGIEKARDKFKGQLTLRAGVEIDYQYWFEDQIARYLETHPFDYVIGSVHYVDGQTVMNQAYTEKRDAVQAYSEYFDVVLKSVESGLIHILGHLEYAKRRGVPKYGKFEFALHREQLTHLLQRCIAKGIVLEINSAGLRQDAQDTYPCRETVELYAQLGGREWCFGSDAHHPNDLSNRAAEVYALADEFNLQLVRFENGRKLI